MPKMMHGKNEKSKDFKGSMIRLFKSLDKFKKLLILGLVLAFISAIFSIVSPNILSDLTDTITDGLKPDINKITEVGNEIQNNLSSIDLSKKTLLINTRSNISNDDYVKYQSYLSSLSEEFNINKMVNLPDSIINVLIDPIKIDGVEISAKDQVGYIKVLSSIKNPKDQKEMLSKMDELPKSIKKLMFPSIKINKVKKYAFILLTLYLLSAIFSYIQGFSMATVSNNFARNLRTKISNKINRLPLKYFDSHETGDVLSRVTNDVDMIGMNMNQSLATLVTSLTLFLGSTIMMFATEWRMAITAIVSSLFGFIFMGLILGKSQKYFNQRQVELGKLNGFIEEIYSGHNVVKAYNGKELAVEEFSKLNDNLFTCNRMSQFLSGIMQPLMGFIGNFGYVCVCIVGAILVQKGYISFGVIVAFMIYIRLFTNPLSQIAQAMTQLQSTAAAAERVFEFLDEKEMTDEKKLKEVLKRENAKGNIEFKHVKFGYDKDKLIIKDFSLKAKSGEKIAIVGPTGAGKTTLVNLLMKFYEINDGDILFDGKSIHDLTRENIHDLFVMVLQDTWLFEGTVKENIVFNKENVSDDEIWNALNTVGVSHFVKTLPKNIECNINDNESISQGQKQLLTIARGMIEDAPFLILDEATSNVDTRTEELVQSAMDKLTKGKTSFIIAHRLSTIKNADKILVMNEGDIIETGTHDELMKKKGFYADLYNSQFKTN